MDKHHAAIDSWPQYIEVQGSKNGETDLGKMNASVRTRIQSKDGNSGCREPHNTMGAVLQFSTRGGVATFFCILLCGTAYLFTEESHLAWHCPGWAGPCVALAHCKICDGFQPCGEEFLVDLTPDEAISSQSSKCVYS